MPKHKTEAEMAFRVLSILERREANREQAKKYLADARFNTETCLAIWRVAKEKQNYLIAAAAIEQATTAAVSYSDWVLLLLEMTNREDGIRKIGFTRL